MAQRTVRSVVDTILAEAGGKTRAQRRADMLGIASVIANRAAVGQTTPENVVGVPSEFNAYGKSFPPGVEAYRDVAQQAWDDVQTIGPTHPGTFYAMPTAVGNLPKGLAPAATAVHHFFTDPALRSFKTAVGFVKPSAAALRDVVSRVAQTAATGIGLAREQAGTVPSIGVNINRVGPAPVGANITTGPQARGVTPGIGLQDVSPARAPGPGLAALAPNGLNYAHATARGPWDTYLDANTRSAALGLFGTMQRPNVTSAYRSPAINASKNGAKNSAHMRGKAIDMSTRGMTDAEKSKTVEMGRLAGFNRLGTYPDGSLHFDTLEGYNAKNFANSISSPDGTFGMFNRTAKNAATRAPGWFTQGMVQDTVPTPTARPASPAYEKQQRTALAKSLEAAGITSLGATKQVAAPVGAVTRGALPSTARPALDAAYAKAGIQPRQKDEPNAPRSLPALDAAYAKAGISRTPSRATPNAPSMPAETAQSRLSTLSDNLSMGAQRPAAPAPSQRSVSSFPARPDAPVSPNTTNQFNAATNKAYVDKVRAEAAAAAAPSPARDPQDVRNIAGPQITGMKALPAALAKAVAAQQVVAPQVAAPVVTAPKQQRLAPVAPAPLSQSDFNARVNPVTPGLRPSDIYGGTVGSAQATGGNTVARDNFGITTVTNQYGVTTGMTPNGKQTAYSPGPFGKVGTFGPKANVGTFGPKAKAAVSALTGAALGSLAMGPVGGLIGGLIGKNVGLGLSPLGTGLVNRAFGSFPDAPSQAKGTPGKPGGGSSTSNRSEAGMRSISPGAARSISKGTNGLY